MNHMVIKRIWLPGTGFPRKLSGKAANSHHINPQDAAIVINARCLPCAKIVAA